MNYQELKEVLTGLNEAISGMEDAYVEAGGEVTETTQQWEDYVEQLKALLSGEGIDMLGRWLTAKEDAVKALKAEKAHLDRKIKAANSSVDFVKELTESVLKAIGQDKVVGQLGYSFSRYDSVKSEVNKEILSEMYGSQVEEAVKGILPAYVTVKLDASVKKFEESGEQELPIFIDRTTTPTVKFVKPRAAKEA